MIKKVTCILSVLSAEEINHSRLFASIRGLKCMDPPSPLRQAQGYGVIALRAKKASVGTDAFEICVERGLAALRAAVAAFAAGGIALAIVTAALAAATAAAPTPALAAVALAAFAVFAVRFAPTFALRLAVAETATVAFAAGGIALTIVTAALAAATAAMAAAMLALVAFAAGFDRRRGSAVGGGGFAATEEAFQPAEKSAGFFRRDFRCWFMAWFAWFERQIAPGFERRLATRFA
jgi:hypothetical protein